MKLLVQRMGSIAYAQLNHHAVPLAHEVLRSNLGIPFVWHFNESPFVCMQKGYFDKLIDLYNDADGKIFINEELKLWYDLFRKKCGDELTMIMDGDLAKADYFHGEYTQKLSEVDREIHTVLCGRHIGITLEVVRELANHNIHLHAYGNQGDFDHQALDIGRGHYHVHPHCGPDLWRSELSKYDAGWIHCVQSSNFGDLMKCTWDDFNFPCRMSTYAAAGLPIIQLANSGHIVASNNYLETKGIGVLYKDIEDLSTKLYDSNFMKHKVKNMSEQMLSFSFDYHIEDLLNFFLNVIDRSLTKGAYSALYYTTIPLQSTPVIPLQSTPFRCEVIAV